MIFIPLTAIVCQQPSPIVSTTIDFEVNRTTLLEDIKTYHLHAIGTTTTTDRENIFPSYHEIFTEVDFDVVIKILPKSLITKKVKIVSVTEFKPKVIL